MTKPKAFVLDTWAIIAFFADEPAGKQVSHIIADANERGIPLWMSIVNVGELWYVTARRTSPAEADATIHAVHQMGIQFDNAEWKLTRQAAYYKSKNKISYADAFSAALALQKNARLVTGDPEFKQLQNELKIEWLHN